MLAPLRRTLRERVDRRSVLGVLVFTLVLAWLFGQSYESVLGSTLLSTVVVGGSDLVTDAYDLRSEAQSVAFGLLATVGGLVLTLSGFGEGTAPAVGALFAVAGAWILLDGVQTLRHEGLRDPDSASTPADGEEVYRQYLAQSIRERLRERPHTRRELREAFEETPDAVDGALDLLRERGLVEREGSAYRARDPPDRGPLRRAGARLARPLTRELDARSAASGGSDVDTPDRYRRTDDARSTAGSDRERADDPDRERPSEASARERSSAGSRDR
jgi:DNA-binding transcriptional ArsR family regulator